MVNQKTFKQLLADPILMAFGIAGFSIGVLVFTGIKQRFSPDQWATWVQAVGSMSAIWISLALVQHQIRHQQQMEQARDARNDYRIASFAESVIREAIDAIKDTERAQEAWPDGGAGYVFHEKSRLQAAQIMTRTLAAEPLFAELIKPVIDMHALLVSVESASEQLVGNGPFQGDSRFKHFWTQKNEQLNAIAATTESAIGLARRSLSAD
ncbi:hypothetical protein LQ564_14580 [Massilia sp. G4R7]|uniref:Uncharacterized protein n=1 Tax=Massilia phyllostachyos TaxID=2898585 RepID=A0ABS8Q725_9BURK|nr:hypothetical protein [Massilia phyllostachyos]MCD2517538.1 hypothetical protein [Massilia phyllostachyos]